MWLTEVAVRVRFPVREFDIFFCTPCMADLGPTELLVQWVQEVLSDDIKCPRGGEAKDTSIFCSVYYSANAQFI
jgi:hypothetical protein